MSKLFKVLLVLMVVVSLVGCKAEVDKTSKDYNRLDVKEVFASTDDGNVAENTIDNYSDTRWSGEGEGATITYDLGKEESLAYIGMSFYKNDVRYTIFDVDVSSDGENWETIFSGNDSELEVVNDLVKIDVDDIVTRYIRITGYGYEYYDGTKTGLWNSITEVQFYGSDDDAMDLLELSETPIETSYEAVGLINADGTVHPVHTPNEVTGKSLNVTKYEADLNQSDTDDAIAIQSAIDDATEGDEVFLPAGIYDLYSAISLKSGVNLRGEDGTILMAKPIDGEYEDAVLELRGVSNVLISDMTITSAFDGAFTTDHKNNNPDADGPRYVIRVQDSGSNKPSFNVTIDNLVIEKYQTMGVRIANSHDVVVKNTTFQNATDLGGGGAGYGVSIQGEGNNINRIGYSNDSRFNVVENCNFVGPYIRHGIIIQYYSHNNLITNNTFTETKLDAIDLHGEDEYLNEISFNTVKDIETGAGIGVGNSGATHDASGAGNYIHDNEIINAREGIKVHLGSPSTVIENNTITGASVANSMGIYLQNAPDTIIRNNRIVENDAINFWGLVINGDSGTEGRGEGVATNVTVQDNQFESLPGGIKVTAGEGLMIKENTYQNVDVSILDTREYSYEVELLPSQVLSLTNWKINLPIENAKEIRQPELKTFEHEQFFYVNEEQDGVVFNAPCQADDTDATTANSKYPRSELREMAYGGMAEANWSTGNGTHIMTIDEMITNTPVAKPHVVVGQIHDADDDVVMIRLEGNRLFVEAEGVDLGALDEDYILGTRFKVDIKAENDVIEISYNGELMVEYPVVKEGCYFKAGMYTQSNVSKGDAPDAYGEVVIYDLNVEHTGVEKEVVHSYTNVDIPSTESIAVLPSTLDTYIDLMKVDGVLTPNVSPRNEDDKLMIKTSSGQTTIRLAFMEFDLSSFSENPYAAVLNLTTKDVNGDSDISIYGFEKAFDDTLVWGDLYTADSRISKKNSEVMDYLNYFGQKTGSIIINPKNLDDEVMDKDHYAANVSSFISETEADVITLVLVEEIGVNVNLQLHSNESNEAYAPTLEVWSAPGETIELVEKVETEAENEEATEATEVVEGEELTLNLDVVDVDEALSLLSYEIIEVVNGELVLPTVIGKDVNISWTSNMPDLVTSEGKLTLPDIGMDVTLTAELTKNEEITVKDFIIVIPADGK